MFEVTVFNKGTQFWLRGTTWAFHAERGDKFETRELAMQAAKLAEKFMAPAIRREYRVGQVAG